MPVLPVFDLFSTLFGYLFFFLRQLFSKFVRRCFGRLDDGSIRSLRKVRIRNETDNFIESISQMVPTGPQMVPRGPRWSPDGPQRSQMVPRGPRWSPEVAKTDNFLRPVPKTENFLQPVPKTDNLLAL